MFTLVGEFLLRFQSQFTMRQVNQTHSEKLSLSMKCLLCFQISTSDIIFIQDNNFFLSSRTQKTGSKQGSQNTPDKTGHQTTCPTLLNCALGKILAHPQNSNSLCALHKPTASKDQSQRLGSFPEKGQITFRVEDQMSLLQRLRSSVVAQQQPRTVKDQMGMTSLQWPPSFQINATLTWPVDCSWPILIDRYHFTVSSVT